ncbi:replication-relaxation family protein [Microbacterium proteolyticum]|uniref:replication-relaxation family protein n=1 Tax=Microbacterium proteolyticum TaxID=1572644 RepID=UPI001FADA310|nr:replication-relaxation family protein [Microbacterium proteolyticum]MCI9857223.1 replication-relaxation family protein [Microbacterium proteolyticum]
MTDTWSPNRIEALEQLLTERDGRILDSLESFRVLSTRQIQRLHYPAGLGGIHATVPTATRLAIRTLLRLEGHGFIARLERRVGGKVRGSAATTWHLAATGERLLRARRAEPGRRRYVEPSRSFLTHTLAVAEVAVGLIERHHGGQLELLTVQTEPTARRTYSGPSGPVTLKPDLYAVIANSDYESHAFIEVDRGTEHLPTVLGKCRTYLQYRQTGTEQAAHDVFPIVIWAVPDERRAGQLRAALRQDSSLPPDLFTICTHETVLDVLATSLTPKGGTP